MEGSLGDLEDAVRKWAMVYFDKNKVGTMKKLSCEALEYNINWSRVSVHNDEPQYTNADMIVKPKAVVLFKTFFSNTTDSEQSYSFQTTRTSKKVAEFSMSSTFTKGGDASLTFKLPGDLLELGASFSRQLEVTDERRQTFEEEISWTVNSELRVPPRGRRSVTVNITEVTYNSEFTLRSTVRGRVRVSVTNPDDNNSLVKHIDADIFVVLRDSLKKKPDVTFNEAEKEVVFVSRGMASFRFGTEQHVEVQEAPPE